MALVHDKGGGRGEGEGCVGVWTSDTPPSDYWNIPIPQCRHMRRGRRKGGAERRHGSTRVKGLAFLAWRSSWRCFLYSYSFSNRSAPDRGKWFSPSRTKSLPAGPLSSSQTGRLPWWASSLAFGLIGDGRRANKRVRERNTFFYAKIF